MVRTAVRVAVLLVAVGLLAEPAGAQSPLAASDLYRLRSVGDVVFSPDATRIAYTVTSNPPEGRPYSQLWLMEVATGRAARVGDDQSRGSSPVWSPDGTRLAFQGRIASVDGDRVTIELDTGPVTLAVADIEKAKLVPRFAPAQVSRSPRKGKKA